MDFARSDIAHGPALDGVVVVVDVLRSFTTAAVAFTRGASAVVPVGDPDSVALLRAAYPRTLTAGALGGGQPAPGFDIGNSPAAVAARDLTGVTLILYTAGGVRALVGCEHATAVVAASLVCARMTAAYVRRLAPTRVTFVITGTWSDRDGDEDAACADLIEAYLRGEGPDVRPYEARVRNSDFGRRFGRPDYPHLPLADLELATTADSCGVALALQRAGGHPVLTPVAAAPPARAAAGARADARR